MGNFFSELVSKDLITDWAEILDWLFDDNRFSDEKGWNGGYVGSFTKNVKKLEGLSPSNYKIKDIVFPNTQKGFKKPNYPVIYMKTDSGEGRDIVRHIRNGIAHGNTSILKKRGELYIEIIDYGKKATAQGSNQTAYMFIPVRFIHEIHRIYKYIEKSRINDKSSKTKNKNTKGRQKQK